jgi:uridylate kinase
METFVISLGGSLIVPDNIDVEFLKSFRKIILKHITFGNRFILISGGGRTARKYMDAANKIRNLHPEDLDWLGIHSTRLNAHLIRTIFRDVAHTPVIKNPTSKIKFEKQILVAAGWKPGCSTDFDAVLLAKNLGVKTLINLSNVEYVYDKDPRKFEDAKKIEKLSWKAFRKIVGSKWDPGLNMPFDPIASKEAEKLDLKVVIANGKDLKNLEKILSGKKFKGTIIN